MRTMKQIRNLSLGLIALAIVSCGPETNREVLPEELQVR